MAKCARHFSAVFFVLAVIFTRTSPAVAGTLTGVSISASNNDAGATTVYTLSFTTGVLGDVPANGRIVLVFPSGFDVSGVSLASNIAGFTGGYSSVGAIGQTVTLQRDGTGNIFNGAVTLRIAAVVNQTAVGNYNISVETQDGSGINIDGPDNDTITIDAAPLDYFTISTISSPRIAGVNFSFTIAAFDAFDNPRSFNGSVTLDDNTNTLTPTSVPMSGTTVTVNNANITLAQSGVQIIASAGGKSVPSNVFTVNPGSLDYVKVVEGPAGDGNELTTKNLTADQSLTVHAAGYDANDNYLGDVTVSWGSTGALAPAVSGTGASITFNPTTAPASGTITADHATAIDDATLTISVSDGAAHRVKVMSGLSGFTGEVLAQGLTAGASLQLHASSFDADDNYIADVSVTWSVSGNIGTIAAGPAASSTFGATTPGTGVINANHSTLIDGFSGTITVNSGTLSSVRIVYGLTGDGTAFSTWNMTADETLPLHAAGYDANGTYLGDFTVTWGSTGSLAPSVAGSGASITFSPTTSGASGTITANHATATDDATDTIAVSDGALHHVMIRTAANGGGGEYGPQTLTADQTSTLHAAGYDADNNFISDVPVTWTVSGGIGSISGSGTSTAIFTATTTGSGFVTAAHASAQDDQTGLITITPGAIASLRILDGDAGFTSDVTNATLTADEELALHAGMFDSDGNYVGDNTATWSSSGLTPAVTGTSTSITFKPTTSGVNGTITATRAGAGNDNASVTINDGAAHHVKIMTALSGNTTEVNAQGLTTGGTLPVHASSFDADDNYIQDVSVTWSVTGNIGTIPPGPSANATFTATTAGTGQINADHASLSDDATGTITVNTGSLSYIKIVQGLSGNGAEFTTASLTADDPLSLHAAGYDASGNYLTDFSVTWGSTGTLAPAVSGSGTSITFNPTTAPASGTITANHATATDDATLTITVSDGAPHHVKIMTQSSGETTEKTTDTVTTGGTISVHASSFDADDNYIADASVTWSVTGSIGTIPAGPSMSAVFSAITPGSGQINAAHATLGQDATGTITVTAGSLSYIKIVEGQNGHGTELTTASKTADEVLVVHAAGYDANNNYLGDFPVTWGSTGTLAPTVSGTGTSITFSPTTSPASGTITANHATATDDATGIITISDGAAAKIKILDTASGEDAEIDTRTLTTNGTLPVHAASFDADNNYIQDVSATWGITGGIGTILPGPSINATFTATTPGTGQVNASHTTLGTDATGTITVNPGNISSITLRTAPNNGGSAFGAYGMTSDDSVTVYAAGYDAGSIYLGDVSVTWSRTGSLAPVASGSGSSFTFRPTTAPASGTIVGNHATAGNDATGNITVSTGKPAGSFTLTANPTGIPADNTTQSTITSSALRDADNNLVGTGKKYTISITGLNDLTIVTADADAGLQGHQIATNSSSILSFNIKAGTSGGTATITAISVDNGLSSGTTTLAIGSINALAITAQPTVSQGQQDVVVQMSVRNIGTSTISSLAGTLSFTVGGNNRNTQYNVTANPSNPTSVAGNTTVTLSYNVDVNSAPAGETVIINGAVTGQLSGNTVSDTDADTPDSWVVQTAVALAVHAVTTTPSTVSRGQNDVTVNVTVRNNFGSTTSATASIDSVRLVLRSGATPVTSQYTITPIAGNPTTIAGGGEATFSFAVDVSIAATLGSITLDARVYGRDANNPTPQISDTNGATTTDSWTVIDAGAFSIISFTTSQSTVTAGMTKTWTATMRLQNNSSSNIGMDLSPASGKTRIRFAVGSDTTGWSITKPSAFDGGGTTLNAGQTRNLTYTITLTSTRVGTAVISGFAGGTDLSTSLPVADNTVDGGSGEVTVQSAASPLISAGTIFTSQPTGTAAQTQNWMVTVPVFNNGQSSIQYSKAQSTITIANGTGYTINKPDFFADGESMLDGFETKNLIFTVDVTGTQVGANLPIAVVFKGVEENSTITRTSNTGNGLVTVQTAAQLRIASTTVTALNGQSVNTGQAFSVSVTVSNLGEESVDSVNVRLATNGNSTIPAPGIKTIKNLTNASPQALQFAITAGSVNAAEKFTASITSSQAHNTQAGAFIASASDDTTTVKVQSPAALQLQVLPTVTSVAAGQTNPRWKIRVRVRNTGGAPLQLNLPAVSNISLSILGAAQSDYAITAPTALQILGGLTLPGNSTTDTLAYEVTRTGEIGGTVTINASISGIDKNDLATRSGSATGSITVVSTAAVRLIEVSPVVFRTNSAGTGFVNKAQSFQVSARVENTSLEAVRDVKVSLAKPAGSQSTISPAQQTIASIAPGDNAPVTFNVTAANLEIPGGEIFEANIDEATASTSGTPARIKGATDSTALVIVESRAQLVVNGSTDDPDNILTTGQTFRVRVKVDNLGQAPYANDGQIGLTVPSGYQRVNQGSEPLTRSFSPGETVTWEMRAPSSDSGPDNFILTIVNRPKDRNTDANAFVQQDVDTVRVESRFSNLAINRLFISSPAGGTDGVVSTDQRFIVRAEISISQNLTNRKAVLTKPNGYIFRFGDQDSTRNTIDPVMTWELQAPPGQDAAPRDFTLSLDARDGQGQDVAADGTMPVRTVDKASLALDAFIDRPQGPRDTGQLSAGQTFWIRAELNNAGTASTAEGQGRVRIDFGNTGVTPLDPLERDIPVNDAGEGEFVEWEVKAPPDVRSASDITVSLVTPFPKDENTGEEASRPRTIKTIAVSTGEQGSVTVSQINISFPGGAQDGIVSTKQTFQVSARLEWVNADNLIASLNLPQDYFTATPTQIPPAVSGSVLTWLVIAPSAPAPDQPISVTLSGKDTLNPQLSITDTSDIINMRVVNRASLGLSAQIISPESATDGSVSIGQYFTVEATLTNSGEAQTTGEDGIYLSLPVGYTTQEPVVKPTLGGKVQWVIRARDTKSPSNNESISFALQVSPFDENTNDQADVRRGEVDLRIFTEPKRLVVRQLEGRTGNSSTQGEQNILLMGLDLQNQSDAGSSNIIVRGLHFTVRNRDGDLVAPNSVLAAIRARGYNNASRLFGEVTSIPEANPLILLFDTQFDVVNAGQRDSIEIVVDMAAAATVTSFFLSLEDSSDIDAIDEDSPSPVEIMDSEGRTGAAFQVRSRLSSILETQYENSFKNYPNPFGSEARGRPDTRFVYYLPEDSDVELRIYSLLGELVWERSYKAADLQGAGGRTHDGEIVWDGRNGENKKVLNGVYLAVLKTNRGTVTRKVAYIK